jgi:hypothetical protein
MQTHKSLHNVCMYARCMSYSESSLQLSCILHVFIRTCMHAFIHTYMYKYTYISSCTLFCMQHDNNKKLYHTYTYYIYMHGQVHGIVQRLPRRRTMGPATSPQILPQFSGIMDEDPDLGRPFSRLGSSRQADSIECFSPTLHAFARGVYPWRMPEDVLILRTSAMQAYMCGFSGSLEFSS